MRTTTVWRWRSEARRARRMAGMTAAAATAVSLPSLASSAFIQRTSARMV